MLSNIEKKLKQIAKIKPLAKVEKNLLWAKIESNLKQNQLSTFFNLKPKFAFAPIIASILIIGSAATVAASNNAKPGDVLYPIDLAVEKVQLAFARGKKKDVLRVQFAQERLDEARIVLAFEESDNDSDMTDTTSTEQRRPDFQKIKKANNALNVALENLEKTKSILEEKGNAVASVVVNGIIGELTELAEDHLADLDDIEAEIKNNGKTKTEINNFRNNLRIKFKIGFNNNSQKGEQGLEKVAICHIPSGNPDNAHTIVIARAAVQAHLDRGDTQGPCEGGDLQDDDNATSTPDTTAPAISNISSSVATNTAEINWDTDEDSDSIVWYSTTTPMVLDSSLFIKSADLVTNHSISLSGLHASTTYYFIIGSTDSSGNKATSTEFSFTTLIPDTTVPIISNMSYSVSTNTADIIWNTDEPSNSRAWYSTTTPMVLDSSSFIESTNLVASHAVSLSNLNASTTYYFIIGSTDSSGNQATSTESSFTTL